MLPIADAGAAPHPPAGTFSPYSDGEKRAGRNLGALPATPAISIAGRHIPGRVETVAAVRRGDNPHGPVAEALWQHLQDSASLPS
ncbi:hypothetical protein FJ567_18270 [Mesorhizobium sp. B2-4-16]|nr:hypothetical protein FJ567_18270 [Mesorhizobium sp. B2-4-16]TPL64238.1 hypothetical protein FJ956_22765 [Mesorhizobium sp. B2-4-3]